MSYSREEIVAKVGQLKTWYHNISLNGVPTNPANPSYPESRWKLIEPHVPRDLTGKTVLDLGCNAGYFSVKLRQRGARVLGVDWYAEGIEQARFVADVLELDIEYVCQNIYEFVVHSTRRFDYVLFLGVFYHLRYPLLVLDYLARMTGEKLYFQTIVRDAEARGGLVIPDDITADRYELFDDPGFPKMSFVEKDLEGSYNNWFVCNTSAVYGVLRSSGFGNITQVSGDCFVCEPAEPAARPKVSHDLTRIRT